VTERTVLFCSSALTFDPAILTILMAIHHEASCLLLDDRCPKRDTASFIRQAGVDVMQVYRVAVHCIDIHTYMLYGSISLIF